MCIPQERAFLMIVLNFVGVTKNLKMLRTSHLPENWRQAHMLLCTVSGDSEPLLYCSANDDGDRILLLRASLVAGSVFDAGYTFFRLILVTALRGGETEAGRVALTKPAQWGFEAALPPCAGLLRYPWPGGLRVTAPSRGSGRESEALREFKVYS